MGLPREVFPLLHPDARIASSLRKKMLRAKRPTPARPVRGQHPPRVEPSRRCPVRGSRTAEQHRGLSEVSARAQKFDGVSLKVLSTRSGEYGTERARPSTGPNTPTSAPLWSRLWLALSHRGSRARVRSACPSDPRATRRAASRAAARTSNRPAPGTRARTPWTAARGSRYDAETVQRSRPRRDVGERNREQTRRSPRSADYAR